MIPFILFIGLWLGLCIKTNWILLLIVAVCCFVFILFRFKKKIAFLFLATTLIGVGTSFVKIDQDKTEFQGFVEESKSNYFILNTGLERLYIQQYDNNYDVGDVLLISGNKEKHDFKTLESSFDFEKYLINKGVYNSFNAKNIKYLFKNPLRIKRIKTSFINKFDDDIKDFVGSIFFGGGFSNPLSDQLRDLHLFRLATLSGLTIHAILHLITYLLSLKIKEDKAKNIAFILLIPYFILAIGKFAILKLVLLFVFKVVNNRFLHKKFDYVSMFSFLGIFLLLIDYHLAYQDSFKLSFLISILLLFFNNSFAYLKHRKKQAYSLILIMLFFIPFESNFYHEISLLGPIFTIALSPLIIFIYFVITLCFYHIPLYGFVGVLIRAFSTIISFIKPSFITIYVKPMPMWFSFMYEIILLMSTYLFSIRFKPLYKIPIIFALIFSFYGVPLSTYTKTYISFINIGQGDSTLIHRKGLDILIDTGGNLFKDLAKECLIPFFKKNQIYNIDYLITTHDDFDHIGARDSLMENFKVKNYLREPEQFPLIVGDFRIDNLNIYSKDSPDENENSLVLKFKLGKTDILVMGDAPKIIENDIIKDHPNLRCDILKVGHHGSNTSSGYDFVKTVDPDVAIISCGKHNKYGHPHDEVIDVLNSLNVNIRRTDIESTITYYF